MVYEVPPEPPDGALALVRSLAQGTPLLRLYRRQGPIWLRDGNGAYAVWEHLVEWDESHAPVIVATWDDAEVTEVWGNLDDQGVFRTARTREDADACTAEYGGWHGMRTARRLVYTTTPEVVEASGGAR